MSCTRASKFLDAHKVKVTATESASRKLDKSKALAIAQASQNLVVSKGKNVTRFKTGRNPAAEAIEAMLGPTGNLRAPTLIVGTTVLVGYNEDVYKELLG